MFCRLLLIALCAIALSACERRKLIKVAPPTYPELVSTKGLSWKGGNVIVLEIDRSRKLIWDGDLFETESKLEQELKRRRKETSSPPSVILRADGGVPYSNVLKILLLVRQSGYKDVSLAVQKEGARGEWLQTFSYE
jgi:biopolymer transport protein ExbD